MILMPKQSHLVPSDFDKKARKQHVDVYLIEQMEV